MPQNVFITGTNTGFGQLTTRKLLDAGHSVVASMRDIDGRNRDVAAELLAAGAHIVELDVTDEGSVNNAVAQAVEIMGSLDVVINNVGVGSIGLLETFSMEDWQASFEVNVFGVQRVNRAALPFMREQGSGLLIFVSSVAGRLALPYFGPYNAAKFALEGLAETCRAEFSVLGIDSCIVEPGPFPTNFIGALMRPSDHSRDASYGDMLHVPMAAVAGFEGAMAANPAQDPRNVADAIVALTNTPAGQRPFRTVVDNMGMGEAVVPYNDLGEQAAHAIYGAFGMADLLKLNPTTT